MNHLDWKTILNSKKTLQKIIITIQFITSVVLNSINHSEFKAAVTNIVFQLIVSSFGGFMLSMLTQYYKKGQWLKYWIWVYNLILFFSFLRLIGFFD